MLDNILSDDFASFPVVFHEEVRDAMRLTLFATPVSGVARRLLAAGKPAMRVVQQEPNTNIETSPPSLKVIVTQ
ncbi:hypothetical protein R1flu_021866 [Riccia fluitans]|uniref:Uncharacterized protein n=1 Tax=Riccia fluitans TaxID=41844 RepID=A0ABD1ZQM3_9MARC